MKCRSEDRVGGWEFKYADAYRTLPFGWMGMSVHVCLPCMLHVLDATLIVHVRFDLHFT